MGTNQARGGRPREFEKKSVKGEAPVEESGLCQRLQDVGMKNASGKDNCQLAGAVGNTFILNFREYQEERNAQKSARPQSQKRIKTMRRKERWVMTEGRGKGSVSVNLETAGEASFSTEGAGKERRRDQF